MTWCAFRAGWNVLAAIGVGYAVWAVLIAGLFEILSFGSWSFTCSA